VHDQGNVGLDSRFIQQRLQIRDPFLQRVGIILAGRLVGKPTADMIGNHGTVVVSKSSNQIPIHEGPTGISVKHDQRLTLSFIQVVISIPSAVEVVGPEIIEVLDLIHRKAHL
jgi:hypothetical protein